MDGVGYEMVLEMLIRELEGKPWKTIRMSAVKYGVPGVLL